jgi:hypothetical protein
MKALLLSVLLIVTVNAKAQTQNHIEMTEIYWGASAPISANLQIDSKTRNLTTINPLLNSLQNAQVTFNNKSLTLTFNRSMPRCAPNMMCIQVMPAPVQVKLQVFKVERTECSVKYLAATPANVRSLVYEQVVIEDTSLSKCMTTMDKPYTAGSLTYKVTGVSSLTKQQETATIELSTLEFIRALN